jgi:flagellar motor switch protein FliN/FliY
VATLDKVAVDITVVLGTTSMPIHQVLRLGRGAIIELDASEEDAVSILANNLPVAKGGGRERKPHRGERGGTAAAPPTHALTQPRQGFVAARKLSLLRAPAGLVPQHPICYMVRHHWTRGLSGLRVLSPCGRGGIGRRTSLRC